MRWSWLLLLVCLVQSAEAINTFKQPRDDVNNFRPPVPPPMAPPPPDVHGGQGINEDQISQFVSIPDVLNQCQGQATAGIEEKGLRWRVTRRPHSQPAGTVIEQHPAPNTAGYRGTTTVELIVAQQPDYSLALNADRLRLNTNTSNRLTATINPAWVTTRAEYRLLRNGRVVGNNNNGSFNEIISSPGTYHYSVQATVNQPSCGKEFNFVNIGSGNVVVVVDPPPQPVPSPTAEVPDVQGLCRAQAEHILRQAGLSYIASGQVSREPIDKILSQSPSPGQYRPGQVARIQLIVSEHQRPNLSLDAEKRFIRVGESVRLTARIDPPVQTGQLEYRLFRNGRVVASSRSGIFEEAPGSPDQYSYRVETAVPVNRCGQEFATLPLRSHELRVTVGTGGDTRPQPPPPPPPSPPPDDLVQKIVITVVGMLLLLLLIRLFRRGGSDNKRSPEAQPDELHIHLEQGLRDMQANLERPDAGLDYLLVIDAGDIEIEK